MNTNTTTRITALAVLLAAIGTANAPLWAGGKKDTGKSAPSSGSGQQQQVYPVNLNSMHAQAEKLMAKGLKEDEGLDQEMASYARELTKNKDSAEALYQAWKQQHVAQKQAAEQQRLAAEQAQKAAAERAAAQAAAKAAEAERQAAAEKKAAEERAAAIAAANAKGVTAADFDYDINQRGTGIVIFKYKGLATVVNIPAVIEGFPVMEIGRTVTDKWGESVAVEAFQGNTEITSVTIPDSVTSVIAGWSEGKYVGGGGRGDDGTYVIMTRGAFAGCTSLKSVTLSRNLKTIPYGMFGDCTSLETITLPAGLERIEERAFANTALKSIVLPDRITRIKEGAFVGTGLTSVVLPKNLETLGQSEGWGADGQGVFEDCTSLESVSFQSRGLWVGSGTFSGCSSLSTLTITENVRFGTDDREGPFDAAPITTVNIGPNVTSIGNSGCIPTGKLSIAAKAAINRVGYNR